MSKYGDSDQTDSGVLIGTPLIDLIPEDAKFTNKPKRQEEQIATDEKGRQRFHGAFTGGFSAGYFNTVGSKEGWQPSTFKSTRSERLKNEQASQRPEDFMDDEDFGDYGIAPKTVLVKSDYKDTNQQGVKSNNVFFDDLLRPSRSTIGVRMLKKMGWREGQGVGPKLKRRLRQLKSKKIDTSKKVYGVSLPTAEDISDIEDDDEGLDYMVSAFDVNEHKFEIKEDLFGLGYKRLDVNEILSVGSKAPRANDQSAVANILFPEMADKTKANSKPTITGQAFGTGDFEDDEDAYDVYKQDNMEKYEFDLDHKKEREAKKLIEKSYGFDAFGDYMLLFSKFIISKTKQVPAKTFPVPEVPKGFNLVHKFEGGEPQGSEKNYAKSASDRAQILGESQQTPSSIFDLVSVKDREFLKSLKQSQESETPNQEEIKKVQTPTRKKKVTRDERYEQFVKYLKQSLPNPYSLIDTQDLTEWDKEKEKNEFQALYESQIKKMEAIKNMGSKFVSTKILTKEGQEVEDEELKHMFFEKASTEISSKPESEIEKAAREKKFGQLTRTQFEWRPHHILCRRFNLPNPYPDAKECGTVDDKKKKSTRDKNFSLFSILAQEKKFEKDSEMKRAEPKIISAPQASGESEIEFERVHKQEPRVDENKQLEPPLESEIEINKQNVYLQDRPDIDIFKAIFDEGIEEKIEEEVQPEDIDEQMNIDNELPEPSGYQDNEGVKLQYGENHSKEEKITTSILSSSIPKLDMKNISRYLQNNDENKNRDYYDKSEYDQFGEEKKEEHASILIFNRKNSNGPNKHIETHNTKSVVLAEEKEKASKPKELTKNESESSGEYEFVEKTRDHGTKSKKKKSHKKKKHHKK